VGSNSANRDRQRSSNTRGVSLPAEKCRTAEEKGVGTGVITGNLSAMTAIDRTGFTPGGNDAKQQHGAAVAAVALTHVLLAENRPVQVLVRDNNVDQALRALKKKMQREGVFREMKLRRNYEKPSERRARERAEAVRRYRKLLRKRMEREGY
jgi:small subunit ribosomal protein S21